MSLDALYEAILDGEAADAVENVKSLLAGNHSAESVLNEACIPAMDEVGQLFEEGKLFVPEMLIAARAMQAALDILRPLLVAENVQVLGKVVLGTVTGDMHDIGKNLVAMMLEGAGFEVIDIGTDVSPEAFYQAVIENQPDVLGMSALLTTTMASITPIIDKLNAENVRKDVKIVIGGAPVTQDFAQKVGADGYADDAASAVRVVKSLLTI